MPPLRWERRPDGLRAPAMVCAFRGWNDAGDSASAALTFIAAALGADRFATIDPEEFTDFQATRPRVTVEGGRVKSMTWPATEFLEVRIPRAPRDLVLVSGVEPALRWKTFTNTIVELGEALGVQLVVGLGSLLADVPHTRPTPVTVVASDDSLVKRGGLEPVEYSGPTGVVGVLHSACHDRGVPAASLWGAVPHYVAATPNPKGALALLRALEGLIGVTIEASELERASLEWERQVGEAVARDPEVQAFVEQLEEQTDPVPLLPPDDIPSGDAIARDLQRFLRQQDPGT